MSVQVPAADIGPKTAVAALRAETPEAAGAQSKSNRTKRRIKSTLGWLATIGVGVALYLAVAWSGFALNTVTTSSMVPTYKPTDYVLSLSPELIKPAIGDAIVFETDYVGQRIPLHVHRIVGTFPDGPWQTKGDANAEPDGWRVQPSDIRGVVVFSIPGALLKSPLLIGGLLFLVVLIGCWPRKGKDEGKDDLSCTP